MIRKGAGRRIRRCPVSGTAVDVGHPLAPYFPRLAIEWIGSSPEQLHRELEGTIAFVDISGFTKLSERLARLGKSGPLGGLFEANERRA